MIIALTEWNDRIAPVFDVAGQVLVVDFENGKILRETSVSLPSKDAADKVSRLGEHGVSILICGAISRPVYSLANAYGIQVYAFVTGGIREVLEAWANGTLGGTDYAMPGCRIRRGRCHGHRGRRRHTVNDFPGNPDGISRGL